MINYTIGIKTFLYNYTMKNISQRKEEIICNDKRSVSGENVKLCKHFGK